VTYKELPKSDTWVLVARPDLALLSKLAKTCKRLDDRSVTRNIFVGLQTSADHIYHLERVGKNRYLYQPKSAKGKAKPPVEEVQIEDAIMHPIVAGPEVHRYQSPITNTFILFPYTVGETGARLMPAASAKENYPLIWSYLKRFERQLRERESGKMEVITVGGATIIQKILPNRKCRRF
jgi:hypothetical protein